MSVSTQTQSVNTNTLPNLNNIISFTEGLSHFTVHQLYKSRFTRSQIVKIKHLKPHVPVQPIKSLDEIQKVKDYFLSRPKSYRTLNTNIRNYCIIVCNINIGLRAGDLLNIKISDIMYDTNFNFKKDITIIESKTGKNKTFSLCNNAREAIIMYLKTRPNFTLDEYLFVSKKYHKDKTTDMMVNNITPNGLYQALQKMKSEVELNEQHIGTHSLRKTFAYQRLMKHKDDPYYVATIQELLNHSNLKTTRKYLGIDQDVKRDVYMNDEI